MHESEVRRIVEVVLEAQRREAEDRGDRAMLETVATILKSFGIDENERIEIRADFAHLRRWRKSVERIEQTGWKAAVWTVVTGAIGLVMLGVQSKFGK